MMIWRTSLLMALEQVRLNASTFFLWRWMSIVEREQRCGKWCKDMFKTGKFEQQKGKRGNKWPEATLDCSGEDKNEL